MPKIKLTKGKHTLVDEQDLEWLKQWDWQTFYTSRNEKEENYYAIRWDYTGGKKRMVYMHRELLGLKKGERSRHMNGKGWDNQRSNLKKLIHEGVWEYNGRYMARIKVQGKYIQLGILDTKKEAVEKRTEAKALVKAGHPEKIKDIIVPTRKSSKYKGVTWNKEKGKWQAYTYIRKDLGDWDTEEKAHEAVEHYKKYKKELEK